MNAPCPTPEELVRLIDGELTENRASTVRTHALGCRTCHEEIRVLRSIVADVAAKVPAPPGAVERVLRAIDTKPARPAATLHGWRWVLLTAAAIAIPLALMPARRRAAPSEWVARGAAPVHSLERDVGVVVYRGTAHLDVLSAGALVDRNEAFSVGARRASGEPAFLLVFAQDATGAVHWIAPAWLDASEDPESPPLAPAAHDAPASAMSFDDLAIGELHVFTAVVADPVRVSSVERMANRPITRAALEERWPGAVVDEITVYVVEGGAK